MLRRLFILALAVSLIGLGPVPLSACSLLSGKVAECATPETQSRCDEMNMDSGPTKVSAAQNGSCCFANAPKPIAQITATKILLGPSANSASLQTLPLSHAAQFLSIDLIQYTSPPPLQSRLCTFLI